jgi:RNA polymerase sigma-70 factor (ECF subfamily)
MLSVAPTHSLVALSGAKIDAAEFERLLSGCQSTVYRIAYGVLGNRADAEDVTQDVSLIAFRKMASLRNPEKFRAWISRAAYRHALNHRRATQRARARRSAFTADLCVAADIPNVAVARAESARLRLAIDALPEKLRAVVLLCGIEGLDSKGVGGVLGIPEGTVRSRLHLARKRLLSAIR